MALPSQPNAPADIDAAQLLLRIEREHPELYAASKEVDWTQLEYVATLSPLERLEATTEMLETLDAYRKR